MIKEKIKEDGLILASTVVFAGIGVIVIVGLTSWFAVTFHASRTLTEREQALQIAEAGIDYYRWHLAHDNDDYQDGQGTQASSSPLQDGLVMWLDARDILGTGSAYADDTDVSLWVDKSPMQNDLEQIGSESVPKKVTDSGFETVEFTDDQLQSQNHLFLNKPVTDVEVFVVSRTRSTGSNGYLFRTKGHRIDVDLPWGNGKVRFHLRNTSNGRIQTDWTGTTAEYALWTFQNSTTLGKLIRRNGEELESESENASQADTPRHMVMGRKHNSQTDYQDINVSELLIYEDTLTSEEREAVEKYLDCKWDITDREDCGSAIPGETYGPFVHEFLNKDYDRIGEFELYITAPPVGSSLVNIQSTGRLDENPDVERTIRTQLAIPSFAKYAFVADADMRFGEGTEVFGPIHSNGGIRFDGVAHNLVTSARESYDDPDHSGSNEFGVHTHVFPTDPTPSSAVPERPDVFEIGRQFPVPAVDFDGVTSDLADMKTDAQSNGRYFAGSGALGYRIDLKPDDTFDIYRVDTLYSPHWSCNNALGESGWSSWSVGSDTFLANYDNPDNGIIFVEDHVWVEGQINTARLTIVAALFPDTPSTRRNIIINDDVEYTNYDGNDVLALIAQNNINVGLVSQDDLRIDAALIAQNGRVGRNYYRRSWWSYSGCDPYDERDTITLYGMIGSKNRYGFAWTDGTGYEFRNINYDPNLLYSPPPSFPLTTDQHEIINWEEVHTID